MKYDESWLDELKEQVITYFENRFKNINPIRLIPNQFPSERLIASSSEVYASMEKIGDSAEAYLEKALEDLGNAGIIQSRVVDGQFMEGIKAVCLRRQNFMRKLEDKPPLGKLEKEIEDLAFPEEYNMSRGNTLTVYIYYRDNELLREAIEAV